MKWFLNLARRAGDSAALPLIALCVLCGLSVFAQNYTQTIPQYSTIGPAGGTGTALTTVFAAAQPLQQIRVVGALFTTDTNWPTGALQVRTGVGAYTIADPGPCATNAAGVTLLLTTTNGLVGTETFVLQTAAGSVTNGTGSALSTNNYITLTTGGFGLTCKAGDQIYVMSSASKLPPSTVTNAPVNYQGDALYVGNKGRPLMFQCSGNVSNTINLITFRYE